MNSINNSNVAKCGNTPWLDLLRIAACFLVVLAHCCDPFVGKFDECRSEFLSGAFWGSFYRPCVPLFIMISGALLLPVKRDLSSFYKTRVVRIIPAFIFWSVAMPFLFYLYFNNFETVNPVITADNHTLGATLTAMLTWVFNFNYSTTVMWYLYMAIGVYLIMPLISPWLEKATKKEVGIVLWIWFITTLLPYVQMFAPVLGYDGNFGNMGIVGVCDWNAYGTFYYLSGYIGYIILAYYLIRWPLSWSNRKLFTLSAMSWGLGYAITSYGFIKTQELYPGDYSKLEVVWFFTGVNVLMMTAPIFACFQRIKIKEYSFVKLLSSLTFGIFLSHFIVVHILYDIIYKNIHVAPGLMIPLIAVVGFVITAILIYLLKRFIPIMKKLS